MVAADMNILGQSALIVAFTAFSLAVTALSRNLRNKLVLAYAVLCSVVSAWAFSYFLETIFDTGTFYKAHLVFNLALAPVGLFFVRVLTRVETPFLRWLYRISFAYAIAVIGLQFSALSERDWVRGLAYFGPSFLIFVCLHLMYIDWRLKAGGVRKTKIATVGLSRRSWIYVGALILLLTAVMDHVPWLGDVVPSIGNILLCLYLFVISEAVIHQRLLNVSALFNRLLVLVFISLGLTLIYTFLVAWIENSPALFVLNSFLASFIILVLIDPIKKLTNLGVMKLFSRKFLKLEAHVDDYQRQLTGVLDTMGLAQLTLQFVEQTIGAESATVFVLRSDGTKFRRIRGLRDDALANREILASHPVVEFFNRMRRRGETPVILDQYLINEIDRSTSQTQRDAYDLVLKGMSGLNANVVIPFMDVATVLGFVAVRAPAPPEPWGNNWGFLTVIYPFFTLAARTLKNMDIYVRLREKDRLATLGEMAAGLAHEIRNPLGAIKGAAQFLQPQGVSAGAAGGQSLAASEQGPFLQVIVEEVNRLNKVVTQFLDYSKPLSADLVLFEIGSIIERTHALFQSAAASDEKMPRIELVAPPDGFGSLPNVRCNPEQIKQVLVNLVQNAVQSLKDNPPAEGGVVRFGAVSERRLRDGALEVVVFVEDNGKGISRENLDKIFIPFFTTSPSGTGLGLPISQRIVEAHGGRIDVISDESKFTRFSVHLPVSDRVS